MAENVVRATQYANAAEILDGARAPARTLTHTHTNTHKHTRSAQPYTTPSLSVRTVVVTRQLPVSQPASPVSKIAHGQ